MNDDLWVDLCYNGDDYFDPIEELKLLDDLMLEEYERIVNFMNKEAIND